MALWGNIDYPNSNQKPVFANTTLTTSNSTINGTSANLVYGVVAGVSEGEQSNTTKPLVPQHAGWVSFKIGTGPITEASIATGGTGINAAGFLVLTDGSALAKGTGANISFTIANTQNTLQAYSTNSAWNGVATLTIVNGGSLYSNSSAITVKVSNATNTTQPTITFTLGGRGDRITSETLVAMGSITLDDPTDNTFFSGV